VAAGVEAPGVDAGEFGGVATAGVAGACVVLGAGSGVEADGVVWPMSEPASTSRAKRIGKLRDFIGHDFMGHDFMELMFSL